MGISFLSETLPVNLMQLEGVPDISKVTSDSIYGLSTLYAG